jgi:hypothetical protein
MPLYNPPATGSGIAIGDGVQDSTPTWVLFISSGGQLAGSNNLTFDSNNDTLTVTGSADAPRLVLKGHSSQNSNLQEWQASNGAVRAHIAGDGTPHFPDDAAAYTQRVGLNSSASGVWSAAFGRNATANASSERAAAFGSLASADFDHATALGAQATAGAIGAVAIGSTSSAVGANSFALGRACSVTHVGTACVGFAVSSAADYELRFGTGSAASGVVAPLLNLVGASSTTGNVPLFSLVTSWTDSTHASRASRVTFGAYYTDTFQEGMRIEGNNGATGGVKISFYGVASIDRQLLATGTGATVDDVITTLQNLGLLRQS